MSCRLWWFLLFLSKFQWFFGTFFSLSSSSFDLFSFRRCSWAYCCTKKTASCRGVVAGQMTVSDRPIEQAFEHNKYWDFFFVCIVFLKIIANVCSLTANRCLFRDFHFDIYDWIAHASVRVEDITPATRDEVNKSCWLCSKTHAQL